MTVQGLRELLAGLPGELEVCRHDSEYGARELETAQIVYEVADRRYRWTYDTREDAEEMAEADEDTVNALVLLC